MSGGEQALAAKPHPGGRPKLTAREWQRLLRMLKEGPRKHGYDTDLWTLRRIAELIEERFGVTYHPSHVWKILQALGWSCQKPERRARERDEQAIEDWRERQWPKIKKNARKGPEPCIH